jgi:hypothetical protein
LNARVAAILVVLLAVLGGAALLYQRQEKERRPSNAASPARSCLGPESRRHRLDPHRRGEERADLERKDER